MLEGLGYKVTDQQNEIITGHGHVKGHIDGIVIGVIEAPKTPHLAEFKTMKDSKFKELVKKGSVKVVHPVYYVQSQMYMHYEKLTRTLFIVVNKNDDDIYIERIKYDKDFCELQERRYQSVLMAATPPDRAFKSTYFECKWCDARKICHEKGIPEVNCRTCEYVELATKGKWFCTIHNDHIPTSFQRKGCDRFKFNTGLTDGT